KQHKSLNQINVYIRRSYMLNALTRKSQLDHMSKFEYDLLIIGGGLTGAGIALDASKRGLNVALVEMQDFSQGTSSRSTKLIHGGLRYLKQMQVNVVKETGRERAIVYENGPHVTTPEWMLLPFHKGGTFGEFTTSLGLKVYDSLAGVDKNERRHMLSKKEVLNKVPHIKKTGLKGGGYYVEYKTDDSRLTIEVMKKAATYGADLVNYLKADGFIYQDGQVCGVTATDTLSKENYTIHAKTVVNAAGPWVDDIRNINGESTQDKKHLIHTKGVHIVFKQEDFPLTQAVYFDTENDGRMIFAIPRQGKTYVGTTDIFYIEYKVKCTKYKKHLIHTYVVYIVFKQEYFPLTQAVYFDTENDGRMIFAIPRQGKTYVGTTDIFYTEDKVTPIANKEDKDYLVNAINYMFP